MNDDLIKRLARADEYEPLGHDAWEAATALTAANATIARLEAALRYIAETTNEEGKEPGMWAINRARAALTPGKGEANPQPTPADTPAPSPRPAGPSA